MISLRDMRISAKVYALIAFCIACFLAFGVYSYVTLNTVKVNGPYYQRIVQGKDLVADILPPPAYIIESYLVVHQLMAEADAGASRQRLDQMVQKGRELRREYESRRDFWTRDLPEDQLRQVFLGQAFKPALEFYDIRDNQFVPTLLAGDRTTARNLLQGPMRDRYEEHRAAVDQTVALANQRTKTDESTAAEYIDSRTLVLLLLGLGILLIAPIVSWLIVRNFSRPLAETVRAIEGIASGNVDQKIEYRAKDEIGALADASRQLLDYTRAAASAADALSRGDLSTQVVVRSQHDVLSRNFLNAIEAMRGVVEESQALVQSARNGDLGERGNHGRFQGAYRDLVAAVNEMLDTITEPINEAAVVLERVAAGDLTSRMAGSYRGDYAKIKTALNTALDNLDGGLSQVAISADQVASAANSIAAGSQSLAQGASEQASALEEVSSSLQEMTSMTRRNAASAKEARSLAEGARTSAEKGVDSMGRLSSAIERIRGSANETAKIVKTIDEIAFQTNLLALNAAVEAARAGDAGKGFAVVAEEVRSLAMRSAEAAKNTANLIEVSVKNAEGGVVLNQEVLRNLTEIDDQVNKVREVMVEIANGSDQQSQGIVQITSAVDQMNQVTQQNAANSEESAAAADELSSQANGLRGTVAMYRLSSAVQLRAPARVPAQIPVAGAPTPTPIPALYAASGNGNGRGKPDPKQLIPFDDADQDVLQSF